ncbi:MAG: hypothetical protein U0610_14360 [bacterium]
MARCAEFVRLAAQPLLLHGIARTSRRRYRQPELGNPVDVRVLELPLEGSTGPIGEHDFNVSTCVLPQVKASVFSLARDDDLTSTLTIDDALEEKDALEESLRGSSLQLSARRGPVLRDDSSKAKPRPLPWRNGMQMKESRLGLHHPSPGGHQADVQADLTGANHRKGSRAAELPRVRDHIHVAVHASSTDCGIMAGFSAPGSDTVAHPVPKKTQKTAATTLASRITANSSGRRSAQPTARPVGWSKELCEDDLRTPALEANLSARASPPSPKQYRVPAKYDRHERANAAGLGDGGADPERNRILGPNDSWPDGLDPASSDVVEQHADQGEPGSR